MATPFNQRFQDSVLRLLITDTEFCGLVYGALDPSHFTSRLSGEVADLCLSYYGQFKAAPADHFTDELSRRTTKWKDDQRREAADYAVRLGEMPAPNRAYILRRVNDAIRLRAREEATVRYAELLAEGKMAEADVGMYAALRSGLPSEEDALDYLFDTTSLSTRGERQESLLRTGVAALDRVFGGMSRGQVVSVLGGAKAGKTWCLQWLARQGLRQGLSVLHISHEVGQDEMELRYDMMLSARGKPKPGREVVELPYHKDGRVEYRKVVIRSVMDSDAVKTARKAAQAQGGRLLIRKYPMGRCTPAEVERYLRYLENYQGFIPDVIINDYVDIMDLTGYSKELRHQINAGYVWSKGLADERNVLIVTASQLNREGLDRRIIKKRHVGEDIRKLANVDTMLAIGRQEDDVKNHLAGLSVLVSRGDEMDVGCTFVPAFEIGQFCTDSWLSGEVKEGEEYGRAEETRRQPEDSI